MFETFAAWVSCFALTLLLITAVVLSKVAVAVLRTERKVDALLRHSGVDMVNLANQEVKALVKAGREIDAIKAHRDLTGASLPEAKAAVERMG